MLKHTPAKITQWRENIFQWCSCCALCCGIRSSVTKLTCRHPRPHSARGAQRAHATSHDGKRPCQLASFFKSLRRHMLTHTGACSFAQGYAGAPARPQGALPRGRAPRGRRGLLGSAQARPDGGGAGAAAPAPPRRLHRGRQRQADRQHGHAPAQLRRQAARRRGRLRAPPHALSCRCCDPGASNMCAGLLACSSCGA